MPETPRIDAVWFSIFPSKAPTYGSLVLFQYNDNWHVAVLTDFTENGFIVYEGNYKSCQKDYREVSWNDDHLVKFINF